MNNANYNIIQEPYANVMKWTKQNTTTNKWWFTSALLQFASFKLPCTAKVMNARKGVTIALHTFLLSIKIVNRLGAKEIKMQHYRHIRFKVQSIEGFIALSCATIANSKVKTDRTRHNPCPTQASMRFTADEATKKYSLFIEEKDFKFSRFWICIGFSSFFGKKMLKINGNS